MPVDSPVASSTMRESSTGCAQCRNGANVTVASLTMCPPSEMPTAHGFGHPDISASAAQSSVSCLMIAVTLSGALSSISRSWHPVTIRPSAFTATAEICVALIFMPTKVRARSTTRSPVCGRPRLSVFSFSTKSFGSFPDFPAIIGISSITPS